MIVATDVTRQLMARLEVEESEARFRSLIDKAPIATAVLTGRQLIVDVANETIINLWGKGWSVIGQPLATALPELAGQPFLQILDDVFTSGILYEAKSTPASLTTDGKRVDYYFDFTYKPLFNTAGEVYAIICMAVDVTSAVIARKRLQASDTHFRRLTDTVPVIIWETRPDGYCTYLNGQWYQATGQTPAEAEGFGWLSATHPDEQRASGQLFTDANDQQIPVKAVYRLRHRDGSYRWSIDMGSPRFDADGKYEGMIGTVVDIHEQVVGQRALAASEDRYRSLSDDLEQQVQLRTLQLAVANEDLASTIEEYVAVNEDLAEANSLLIRSNDNLQQFAYVASHDLQEPLRKIQQFGDLLKLRFEHTDSEEMAYLNRMQAAAGRMSTLIRDLLNFSRLSTTRETSLSVSLSDIMNMVLADLEVRIQETGAVVQLGHLPVVQGDRSQLEQLFQNLVSNALKFQTPATIPLIRINSRLIGAGELPSSVNPSRHSDNYHRVDVADNGVGFDEKYLDRIFQVFQRLHGRTEFAGTGIGLAICKRVAANHGGDITATSLPGQGATFSVYLPAQAG